MWHSSLISERCLLHHLTEGPIMLYWSFCRHLVKASCNIRLIYSSIQMFIYMEVCNHPARRSIINSSLIRPTVPPPLLLLCKRKMIEETIHQNNWVFTRETLGMKGTALKFPEYCHYLLGCHVPWNLMGHLSCKWEDKIRSDTVVV